jgi:hypothetical protein
MQRVASPAPTHLPFLAKAHQPLEPFGNYGVYREFTSVTHRVLPLVLDSGGGSPISVHYRSLQTLPLPETPGPVGDRRIGSPGDCCPTQTVKLTRRTAPIGIQPRFSGEPTRDTPS